MSAAEIALTVVVGVLATLAIASWIMLSAHDRADATPDEEITLPDAISNERARDMARHSAAFPAVVQPMAAEPPTFSARARSKRLRQQVRELAEKRPIHDADRQRVVKEELERRKRK